MNNGSQLQLVSDQQQEAMASLTGKHMGHSMQ